MKTVEYSKDIYDRRVVEYASDQFGTIMRTIIKENAKMIICSFTILNDVSEDVAIKEFENYMIDFINSEKLYND